MSLRITTEKAYTACAPSLPAGPVSYTHLDVYKRQERQEALEAHLNEGESAGAQITFASPDEEAFAE